MIANTSLTSSGRQPHRGLVHQDHLRARHQRAANRQHLLLAAGEITGEAGALLQAREIPEDHVDVVADLVVAAGKGAEPQIFQRRHVGDDAAAFHHLEDAAADDLVGVDAVDALAVEDDFAAGDFAVLGLSRPEIAFSVVDFPAPLAPSSATIAPFGTSRLRPRSTRMTSSYTTSMLRTLSSAAGRVTAAGAGRAVSTVSVIGVVTGCCFVMPGLVPGIHVFLVATL